MAGVTEFLWNKAEFIPRTNEKACTTASLNCGEVGCTANATDRGSAVPWEEGCEPVCGLCRTGFTCSGDGKCAPNERPALTSGTSRLAWLGCLFVFVFFM